MTYFELLCLLEVATLVTLIGACLASIKRPEGQ